MNNRFTKEDAEAAHNTNLVDFLTRRGESIKFVGNNSYWKHNDETISLKGNLWFNHYTQKGGEAIGFVKEFFGVDYKEAVCILLGKSLSELTEVHHEPKPKAQFILPERNPTSTRVFAYLTNTRGIDRDVVSTFMKAQLIYEDKKHHNAVFVGKDKDGTPRHAHMRGSSSTSQFKMNAIGSDPNYSFHWTGNDNELFIFEAPIDMLSYISMFPNDWQNHTYAASCSVADRVLFQCLYDNPNIDTVHICFDNDVAGQSAAERIIDKLASRNINADILKPDRKDWNEDLTAPNVGQTNTNSIKID